MVSQLFVELSIGGTWWLCWRTGLGLLQFSLLKNIFGDDNYFEETSSLLSPFSPYNYFWILGSFKLLKTGEPNKYKFFMQPLLFLVKLLVETAARKCLISVYGKDYCGDSCNWEIHFICHNKEATSNRSKALFRIKSMTVMLINLFVAKKVHFVV